ncbi:PREDICTED: vegetative cell wall protein gp1-like isoform X2 [Ipomoea nil]|uniref:vegetative cell wall protein gp1-like isoform X2 n=1 Tax=Ipomoea nil TaxID=35883 RepID=UPI000901E714|nr:PREDICTED: vegetative cell wall protein gp1-like isoform X2 [Ipomoea nil]
MFSSSSMGCQIMIVICMGMIIVGANGQINTPCTNSIVSSFTPCFNYITGSGANGSSSPTQDCCDSLKSIMTNMIDCACLIITGNVPLSIPFVRTLVLNLPLQQCSSGVPVQCKGSGAPLSAPAVGLTPAYSPQPHHHHHHHHPARPQPPALAPHSSRVSKNSMAPSLAVEAPALAPASAETVATPPSPPPPTDGQPNKKSSPVASKEKGTPPPMAAPLVPNPKKIPAGMNPLLNPSKTSSPHQPNSSPPIISPSFHSLSPLLLFVPLSLIFL